MRLDSTDLRILAILQQHGRISNLELADQVGLSPTPCSRRVKQLEDAGVIRGYRAIIDPAALGLGVSAMIGIRLQKHDPDALGAFLDAVRRHPAITECLLMAGDVDYLLRVRMPSVEALKDFILNGLTTIPAVGDTSTMLILEASKPEAALPVPAPDRAPQRAGGIE